MRVAISALLGIGLTTSAAIAFAQPAAPPPPPPGAQAAQPGPPQAEAPPPPPAPGTAPVVAEAPPALPPVFPAEGPPPSADLVTAGWNDGFYVMDSKDYFRLYPGGVVQTDLIGFFGPGISTVPATNGGTGLSTRFIIRRAQIILAGEFLKRWTFRVQTEFGGSVPSNVDGRSQLSAAPAGMTPTADTARYAPVDTIASGVQPLDAWINYRFGPWLNFMAGQFTTPFSMENRTIDPYTPWMERNLAIRAFAVTSVRDLGAMIWGDVADGILSYEIGMFGGEGQNRPSVDSRFDFMGRVFVRPLSHGKSALEKSLNIGVSARHGDRDPKAVGYDYSPITSGQGFIFWKPTYTDSLGRLIHVIPSGAQNAIGGELRARTERFSIQAEAYYVHNNTREAVDGFQMTNTERFGRFQGVSWYAQLSAWPFGDSFLYPEPGKLRPKTMDLANPNPAGSLKRGVELLAIAAGINANYSGATRVGSTADAKTPSSDVTVYEFGLGAQYWHSKHTRFSVNYIVYDTPGSGDAKKNLAVVPDNLPKPKGAEPGTSHVLHEIGARLSVVF